MIPYIIHVALIVTTMFCFYRLLLRKETFFQLNRFVLLGCIIAAFALPFIAVPEQWSLRKPAFTEVIAETISPASGPSVSEASVQKEQVSPSSGIPENKPVQSISVIQWIIYLYWFGVIAFAINFLIQLFTLLAKAYTNPAIRDGKIRIVELSNDAAPCSFLNNVFINPSKYDWETYTQILNHEKIHIQQGHTYDLLLSEIVLIFQWFNPFAWLYRKEMENNLEFLTDRQMLEVTHVEKTSYQMSLLKVSAPHFPLNITTNYNQSLLKKRVSMMNAKKSNIHTAWKYVFMLPLLVFTVCLLNDPKAYSQANNTLTAKNSSSGLSGTWTAEKKGDLIVFDFTITEPANHSIKNFDARFAVKDISNLPENKAGKFVVQRDAGSLQFNGMFDGNEGVGKFTFTPDKSYLASIGSEGIAVQETESINFFLLNISPTYVRMLKSRGYTNLTKKDLSGLASQNVGKERNVSNEEEEPAPPPPPGKGGPLENLINFKSAGITEEYITSFEKAGFKDIPSSLLINFKLTGITPEYIKSFHDKGYKDIPYSTFINFKSVGVTPEYIKSFQDKGYKDVSYGTIVNLKANKISPPSE